ncbi:MAG: chromosome segregation protein SMC [Dehalococcoidia bacterium]
MYLKKLTLQGFKSFANRTTFEYTGGITAVVGPNGSGKSNVTDALRWVLGEQSSKLLRAKKQEDVIFAGTRDRAAVGLAEVILTLDNSDRWLPLDFAEVEVGRRVYRNGDSEYLLNGQKVRLRDVADLLMSGDVGQNSYTILGQGLVDEVLSMSPDERRGLLDEAADVKRFRLRIKEAQDRLNLTQENIGRVRLVIAEIEPRLAQLSRQAERALEHAKLSAELAELLRIYYIQRWDETQNGLMRVRAALDQSAAETATAQERVDRIREQLRLLSDEIRRGREILARREAAHTEITARVRAVEQSLATTRERSSNLTRRVGELRNEVAAAEQEHAGLGATDSGATITGDLEADVAAARKEVETRRAKLAETERTYLATRARAQQGKDMAEADVKRAGAMESDERRATARIAEIDREIDGFQPRRRQVIAELKAYGGRYRDLRAVLMGATQAVEEARLGAAANRDRLARVQEEVRAAQVAANTDLRELDRLEGRLDALRRVQAEHDGVAAGTRAALIMGGHVAPSEGEAISRVPGIHGLLARHIKVPAGLEIAVNAALEHRLHAIVVEDEDTALRAIEQLQSHRRGRAQFLALDTLRHVYALNLQKEKGVVGVAAKLVKCENAVRALVDTLLGRVIIVEDVPTAQRIIKRGLGSVVTVDGTYVEVPGLMVGGATGADEGGFVRQREMEELPAQIDEVRNRAQAAAQQLHQGQDSASQLSQRVRESDQLHDRLRRELDQARSGLQKERDRLHRHRRDLDALKQRRGDLQRERERNERQVAQARHANSQLQAKAAEHQAAAQAAEAALQEASAAREAALGHVAEANAQLAALDGEHKTIQALREQHQRSVARALATVQARRGQLEAHQQELAAADTQTTQLEAQLAAIQAERSADTGDTAPDRDELSRLETHERTVQAELNTAQGALLEADRRRLDLEAEQARLLALAETLQSEMSREGLAYGRREAPEAEPAVVQGAAAVDLEDTRKRIEDIRRQVRKLGPINGEAPEDYRESKERHEFLTAQIADLTDAEAQLRDAIAILAKEIESRFVVTYGVVDSAFQGYFKSFFGGGEAKLILTDPDNPADCGLEIDAQPPGKRVRSLAMLSGGERSLTAVALLFALLAANPAPFCVLDEVDAALDEANVGRFTGALKKLSEKTQFLMVTHNRRTLDVADAIYGVSMARDGVSKVLSLRLSEVPQET